ncbi:hypothetical protein ACA097_19895 [Pseudomonas sp. QL9]|uniref:hypothetical protein n=1 Tax=Pseudomonas sp. QL9 TaxID=3242725 RepID=UPI00352B0AEF
MERTESTYRGILLFAALLSLAACTSVKLISDYDEVIDSQALQLQKKIDSKLTSLRFAADYQLKYQANQDFYRDALTDLNAMSVRASAIYQNQPTLKQIELAKTNLAYLVLLNKGCVEAPLSSAQIAKVEANGIDLSMDCHVENGATSNANAKGEHQLNRFVIPPVQALFNQHLGAIMALELAKKRGDGTASAK